MNHKELIDTFTWSYSRLTSFDYCPYGFYLSYIQKHKNDNPKFFAYYGIIIHEILEDYYNGDIKQDDMLYRFIDEYSNKDLADIAPTDKIAKSYMKQGVSYFANFKPKEEKILGVEKKVEFDIDNHKFVGYIDKVSEIDGKLVITDNKSHNLKPRSNRKTPTKTDVELDSYLKQLYLYSIPLIDEMGKYPDYLAFNCFRTQTEIIEPFVLADFQKAKAWASEQIEKIRNEEEWLPLIDMFKCKHICDHNDVCEYYLSNFGG